MKYIILFIGHHRICHASKHTCVCNARLLSALCFFGCNGWQGSCWIPIMCINHIQHCFHPKWFIEAFPQWCELYAPQLHFVAAYVVYMFVSQYCVHSRDNVTTWKWIHHHYLIETPWFYAPIVPVQGLYSPYTSQTLSIGIRQVHPHIFEKIFNKGDKIPCTTHWCSPYGSTHIHM